MDGKWRSFFKVP